MFVRKKNNRSGTVSVVIVNKHSGAYREIHTVGTSSKESEVAKLVEEGKKWIRQQIALPDMFDKYKRVKSEQESFEYFFSRIENILLNGPQLLLNRVFCLTGFDRINDSILKDLVVARICRPRSKSATVDYLKG